MKRLTEYTPPLPVTSAWGEGTGQVHNFSLARDDVKLIAELDTGSVIVVQVKEDRRRGLLLTPNGGHGRLTDDEVTRLLAKEKP